MSEIEMLLLGVLLGAAPSAMVGRILAAWLAKRAGVKPGEIAAYSEAADGDAE
jgi:threonine synthase